MKLAINIEEDIFEQFSKQLNAKRTSNILKLDPTIGEGAITFFEFPNALEFYHYKFKLNKEVELSSSNSKDSEHFLININLSEKEVEKNVNGQDINFQRYLPSGILFYPPGIKVSSKSPAGALFEIVLIKFHKKTITTYFEKEKTGFFNIKDTIVYEDLEVQAEDLLRKIIVSTNKLKSHSYLLAFLATFLDKLKLREEGLKYGNLHPQDIKQLFLAAALLRNPTPTSVPSVEDLAKVANMGKTKFKDLFKQIFGSPPKQYHQKIRMEYAKEELQKNKKNSTELAYELGYAHPSKFTRAFKKHFGALPSKI